MNKTLLSLFTGLTLLAGLATAADWPQWQGPDRNNVSKETGLLKSWPNAGPKLLWTCNVAGVGYSGPAIVGQRLYTMGADKDREWVIALDVSSGKRLWSTEVGEVFQNDRGGGPRGTPTVDGDLLYAISGQGDLVCVNVNGGQRVWLKRLRRDLNGRQMSGWGYSESPLVDGDQVVCTPGGAQGAVAAFNKKTGQLLWRTTKLTDPAAYCSPVVTELGGVRQFVVLTGSSVSGIAAKDGRLLWRFPRMGRTAVATTPLCHENYVYLTSGYGVGCNLIKVTATGGDFKAEEVYANKNMVNHHGGVVLVDGHVYGYSDGKGWVCQDFKSGDLVWQERSKLGKGSPMYADGRLCCYAEQKGVVALLEATTAGYRERGRFTIPQESQLERPQRHPDNNFWTHPVVANGRLYLRDQELIFCYDVKNGSAQ